MPCYQFDIFLEPTDVVHQLIHKSKHKIKFLESSCKKICVADGTVFLYHDIVKPIISQNGDLVGQIRFIKSSGYPNNYFYILCISFTILYNLWVSVADGTKFLYHILSEAKSLIFFS